MNRFPLYILADNIRSLENIGSLFRIADALNVSELFLVGISGYPDLGSSDTRRPYLRELQTKKIKKTALAALGSVPFSYFDSVEAAINEIARRGIHLVVVEQTTESIAYCDEYTLQYPLCLVFGNERDGVHPAFIKSSELTLSIPQYGVGRSLNVSVCAGIVGFEIMRRYLYDQNLKTLF